ncbi:MAG: hypothetical protein VX860_09165, partial [Verrucomicrobiota bacterium]|nr:hypothetical protein [Verrucomicrobiota bacterium]
MTLGPSSTALAIASLIATFPLIIDAQSQNNEESSAKEKLKTLGITIFTDKGTGSVTEVLGNGNNKVSDSDLILISNFKEITDLSLERTQLTDVGIHHLSKLKKLEWLNLYETKVGNVGLEHISKIKSLK